MEATQEIDGILSEASTAEVKELRQRIEDRMKTLGFVRAKVGPGNFTFRNLKHNLHLMRFMMRSFPEKMPDIQGSTRLYIEAFCQEIRGCLSISLLAFPGEGLAFYSVTSEQGITAYVQDFVDALELYDRVSRNGISPSDLGTFIGPDSSIQ